MTEGLLRDSKTGPNAKRTWYWILIVISEGGILPEPASALIWYPRVGVLSCASQKEPIKEIAHPIVDLARLRRSRRDMFARENPSAEPSAATKIMHANDSAYVGFITDRAPKKGFAGQPGPARPAQWYLPRDQTESRCTRPANKHCRIFRPAFALPSVAKIEYADQNQHRSRGEHLAEHARRVRRNAMTVSRPIPSMGDCSRLAHSLKWPCRPMTGQTQPCWLTC